MIEVEHHGSLLSPLRGCMSRRIYVPMGESAHGYIQTPLRGDGHGDRDFQGLEDCIERPFPVAFRFAKVTEKRYFCGAENDF